MRRCALCRNSTNTSICATCTEDLAFLGCTELPDPDATDEEVREWAKKNKVQVFVCNEKDMGPGGLP